ncbi:MAG: phosphate signaling complex PhoU family protein [Burkholderiales bacterium]
MTDHTSKDYDDALERARRLVSVMGARVERQLADAIDSLQSGSPALIDQILRHEAEVNGLERAIDEHAGQIVARRDLEANKGFRAVLARLAGFMVEDPRTISPCLDILFVAKSLERIGDHAKNIGEHVVYAAMGTDVRHASAQEIERVVRS